jgi:ferritin-like metal-binding protein YciE
MATISNPRDLLVELLGQVLFVERRLAGGVLRELAEAVRDDELKGALRHHLDQTAQHAERVEVVFRRLEVAPTANLSRAFESATAEHDELAAGIEPQTLADVFHAQAALHTEHWEIAAYTAVLALADAMDRSREVAELRDSLQDEQEARATLEAAAARLAGEACAR